MDAVILAGGFGTRLQDVVPNLPKPLAPVNGRPFLEFLLEQLDVHAERIILAVGYRGHQIRDSYPSLIYSEEKEPLGTGGALKKALKLAISEDVFALNGDSYFDIDLENMLRFHQEQGSDLTIACRQVEDVSRYGAIVFDENETKQITQFDEKSSPKAGWINGGIYLIKKNLLSTFDEIFSLEKEGFPKLLSGLLKKQVYAYPASGKFIDIGTKASYFQAQEYLCIKS